MAEALNALKKLRSRLQGELHWDHTTRTIYATDASAYRQMPEAVAYPRNEEDIRQLILFAREQQIPLVPRTAGTSLAGQVVGPGIIVDMSRFFTGILEVNKEEKWVRLQPGVIRDELNKYLIPYGLMFGPETSTSNRAMVGGMVGNNSCGAHSIIYGSTRDHLLEVKGFLSDGTPVHFKGLTVEEYQEKLQLPGLEGELYRFTDEKLQNQEVAEEIRKEFPKPEIHRRNTGYAIDLLLGQQPFAREGQPFNFCKLIAGSEGTLVFITELKLNLLNVPPPENAVVAVHLKSIDEATRATLVARQHNPGAIELMDKYILDCTRTNREQRQNRDFVEGDPQALMVVEFERNDAKELEQEVKSLIDDLKQHHFGYHFPVLRGEEIHKVWTLRKAGLGLLANVPGDAKPVPCIEDTAVSIEDQPQYLQEFDQILAGYGKSCVYYAHIGDGEIHLRPILNLKDKEDRQLFYQITDDIAGLVKKFRGSLSGEHGDGRVRGPFVRKMIGEKNYALLKELKQVWDPQNIFNPGKIVDTPPMLSHLRYEEGQTTREIPTLLDFPESDGIMRMAEKCNGTGDCRKTEIIGGTMCPSYHATRNEKDTTRARANLLRETLSVAPQGREFDNKELKDILDLCLSCKGCKSECPSNVDMAKLKAEFQFHYQQQHGIPWRTRLVSNFTRANRLASRVPGLYNFMVKNPLTGALIKSVSGFSRRRSLPTLGKQTLEHWLQSFAQEVPQQKGEVWLFVDEFTNYNDLQVGQAAVKLLNRLGYRVDTLPFRESGRTYLSKGLLDKAQPLARENVKLAEGKVTPEKPLLGVEPSALLSFRDEYLDLLRDSEKEAARELSANCFLVDEFVANLADQKQIDPSIFTGDKRRVRLHAHCHQKALASQVPTKKMLSLPKNYEVLLIPSGCCGMAGSFGYEKEHFDISMKVGELVLFPTVRQEPLDTLIAAPGTSCRHQIKDGTGRQALHPVEILYQALL